ncbi:MAG: anti-sigma regulatory factor [Bacteroidetes bacterium]|nr:anti-sigma regulatory factor [Bacteroidota bacterium]
MATRQKVFRLTLSSKPKNIGRVEGFLKKIDRTAHLDEIQEHKLMIALTEAVNNAILHGNRSNEEKKVRVVCEVQEDGVLFTVTDEGKGFRPDTVANPLKEENLLKESGRGIFLMRTLLDRVEFHRTRAGMEVKLWLLLGR